MFSPRKKQLTCLLSSSSSSILPLVFPFFSLPLAFLLFIPFAFFFPFLPCLVPLLYIHACMHAPSYWTIQWTRGYTKSSQSAFLLLLLIVSFLCYYLYSLLYFIPLFFFMLYMPVWNISLIYIVITTSCSKYSGRGRGRGLL